MASEETLETEVSGAPPAVRAIPLPAFPRISWGAIFGGAVAGLAIWMLLYTLGLALGLSAVDPENTGSLRSSGLFTGIWSAITPLIALFVGGWVASQAAGVLDRKSGAIHGLVMWGVTLLLGAALTFTALGSIVGGLASVGKSAVQAGGGALSGLAGQMGEAGGTFGIDADDALGPVNQRLQSEGKASRHGGPGASGHARRCPGRRSTGAAGPVAAGQRPVAKYGPVAGRCRGGGHPPGGPVEPGAGARRSTN